MSRFHLKLALLSSATLLALPAVASAQTAKPDEVVVTAQKRAENVQQVPVSITVIQSAQLTDAGVHNFQDLSNVAPSLGVTAGGNGQNSSVVMRGVGAFSYSYLTEPDVAIIIDDVPVASQSQAFTNLSDVAQIEVLSGPQTTLFGKSASAGVVSITTLAPTKTLTGRFSASVTGDGEETLDASISGPLTDTLTYRLTASTDDFKGNVRNIATGHWENGEDATSIKGKLHYTPTSKLTFDLAATYINATGSLGLPQVPASAPASGVLYATTIGAAYSGININTSNSSVKNDVDDSLNYNIAQGAFKAAYDAGPVTLMSITGYSNYSTYNNTDFDGTATNVLALETNGAQNGGLTQVFNELTTQFSEELRAISAPGPFRYVAGLWYANKMDEYDTVRGPSFPGLGTHLYANYYYKDWSTQYAIYGQSEWDFAPQFTLVTGLRASQERIAYNFDNVAKNFPSNGAHLQGAGTGKASLEYHVTPDINLFAGYTRGYKGETYDLTSSFNAALAANGPVKSETSNNYEIGAKTQFFDHRLTLNLTAFDTQYYNFQAQTVIPILGAGFVLANVGSLQTRGLELDGRARVTSRFNLNFGGTLLDATITHYPDGQCYYTQTAAQGCLPGPLAGSTAWNLAGKTLPNAPKFKGNIDAQYDFPVAQTGFDAVLDAAVKYQTAVNFSLSPDPKTEQPAYAIVNLSLKVLPTQGPNYSVSVFVNNVFDTHYYAGMLDLSSVSTANSFGILPRDFRRYAGVRASYAF
jgi:iron complex outermembrane receptor protein